MKRALLFLAAILILGGIAQARNITGPIGCAGWGLAGLTGPLTCTAAPPPPTGCDGTIDLSTGCVMPMLR